MKLAVIPARGGSKRIPRKNIREFAGKPMIVHAIEAAERCDLFDHVVVSTDDEEIAAVKKALEDMKWKKEMEERVQEILESVKACEKKIEETTKEENNGENKEEADQTTEQQTEETAEKSVEEEIKQETKQEVINDPVVPE